MEVEPKKLHVTCSYTLAGVVGSGPSVGGFSSCSIINIPVSQSKKSAEAIGNNKPYRNPFSIIINKSRAP